MMQKMMMQVWHTLMQFWHTLCIRCNLLLQRSASACIAMVRICLAAGAV